MSDYNFDHSDGKLHTRYSDIARATPAAAEGIILERAGLKEGFHSTSMDWGTLSHKAFEEESKATGRWPKCFGIDLEATYVEQEFVMELFEGVVVHSRFDLLSVPEKALGDVKTMVYVPGLAIEDHAKKYLKHRQLPFYALSAIVNGLDIRWLYYLVEVWTVKRDAEGRILEYLDIVGYSTIKREISLIELGEVRAWALERCNTLAIAKALMAKAGRI